MADCISINDNNKKLISTTWRSMEKSAYNIHVSLVNSISLIINSIYGIFDSKIPPIKIILLSICYNLKPRNMIPIFGLPFVSLIISSSSVVKHWYIYGFNKWKKALILWFPIKTFHLVIWTKQSCVMKSCMLLENCCEKYFHAVLHQHRQWQ